MTMPAPGQTDPTAPPPEQTGQPKPEAKPEEGEPKSVEEQLAELTSKFEDLQSNSRKWEKRAKDNKAKADQWDAAQTANATPDQKLALAEERAAKAERELARHRVAIETGLPAELIVGDDEDAMRDHAKALADWHTKGATPKTGTPKPDPSQGGSPGGTHKPSAREAGVAEARRRFPKN